MSEKHINKNSFSCEAESKSPLPCGGGLGVGIIPQGYKQTNIGIIPQDWEVVRLGEVANFFSGGTPLTTNRNYYNGTIPFIKSAEIYFDTTQEFLTDEGLQNSSAKWVSKGDLLFALYGANSGEVAISKIDGVINQAVLCIKNDIKISDATFLYNYFLMIKRYLVAKFLQGGQGNLSAQIIKSLQVPLPPLKEQEKIARILGVWDSALDTLANLIKAKRKYKTALMQRLLTPPCHTDAPLCHTEGVARSIQKENLQGNAICLDSSVATLPQNDKEKIHKNDKEISPQNDKENPHNDKFMDCHENPYGFPRNDNSPPRHTPFCHTDFPICHTERSEVSKSKGVDFVDTSAFSKPQYDKVLDSCNASPLRHCEEALATKQSTKESLRFAGFSDKWQEFRLGDICKIKKGEQLNKLSLSDDAEGKFAVINGGILPSGYTDKFNTHENTITISEGGNSCGFVNLILEKFWSGGHCYTIMDNKADTSFLFHFLKFKEKFIQDLRVGSGLPNIQKKDIENFKIFIPTLAEQKKIAQVLSACDKEIETLNLKFECLKEQKKGLMQQLLSGSVRVKCENAIKQKGLV